jgi:hypothetical protein
MLTVCLLMVMYLLLYVIWPLFPYRMCNELAKNKGRREPFDALILGNRFSRAIIVGQDHKGGFAHCSSVQDAILAFHQEATPKLTLKG